MPPTIWIPIILYLLISELIIVWANYTLKDYTLTQFLADKAFIATNILALAIIFVSPLNSGPSIVFNPESVTRLLPAAAVIIIVFLATHGALLVGFTKLNPWTVPELTPLFYIRLYLGIILLSIVIEPTSSKDYTVISLHEFTVISHLLGSSI